MAGKVLPSIEPCSDPEFANGSEHSDDTYIEEEGTPQPDDPEAWLIWGRKKYGEEWYQNTVDGREAALSAQREEEERERIKNKELEDIESLRETDPMEYERRMRIYKLVRKGLSLEQIEKLNQPLPREEADRIQEGFAKLLGGKTLPSTTTQKHVNTRLRPQKSAKSDTIHKSKIVKGTARKQPKRPTSILPEALLDEESASNATNAKVTRSKHDKTRQRKTDKVQRTSRRLANDPVECGIFAGQSEVSIPSNLQRDPSMCKSNPAGLRSKKKSIVVKPAKHREAMKFDRESIHHSRPKKESGG